MVHFIAYVACFF